MEPEAPARTTPCPQSWGFFLPSNDGDHAKVLEAAGVQFTNGKCPGVRLLASR